MATMEECARCGEHIDKSACGETYTIMTVVTDSDETGTKKEKKYLCSHCTLMIQSDITNHRIDVNTIECCI